MIHALQPLTKLTGVQLVMFVSEDGVPIAIPGQAKREDGAPSLLDQDSGGDGLGRHDAIAAVATGWLREIQQGVALASWHEPTRVVLRGIRGTLVMQRARGAVLLLLLSRGLAAEEVRLPMDAAVARLRRNLEQAGREPRSSRSSTLTETPGPMPSSPERLPREGAVDVGSDREPS